MKFCTKCGTKLEEGESICHNCGYDLNAREYKNNENDSSQSTKISQKEDNEAFGNSENTKIVISKNFKIGLMGIIILCILIGVFVIVGKYLTDPSKLVSRFQSDISSSNKADLNKILYSNDERLEINDTNTSALFAYFKDNPSYLNKTISGLDNQVIDTSLIKNYDNTYQNNFSIVNVGKTLLLFPKYKISVKPTFIDIKAGIKDVEFSVGNTKIGKSDTDNFTKEFGPFMPGKYKLYANYKGKYTSLNKSYDVDLINAANGRVEIDALTNLNYVKVTGQYSDAEIFVDNKDTGVTIGNSDNFGPLASNMKVYAVANENGKKLKSNEYTVNDGDTSIYLDFSASENQLSNMDSQIHDLIYWYTNSFSDAINYNNFSEVEPYLYPGSALYNDQQAYVPDTYNKGTKESIVSFNILSYTMADDNKSGTISTEEVYNITNGGQTSTKTFKYNYTFKYNEDKGSYQLASIASAN